MARRVVLRSNSFGARVGFTPSVPSNIRDAPRQDRSCDDSVAIRDLMTGRYLRITGWCQAIPRRPIENLRSAIV
jgi:hypothetical protein